VKYHNEFSTELPPHDIMLWIEWQNMYREGIRPTRQRAARTAMAFGRMIKTDNDKAAINWGDGI
jgi:hypothetical protein